VLYALRGWAERWAYTPGETGGGPAMRYVHRACGADVGTATIWSGVRRAAALWRAERRAVARAPGRTGGAFGRLISPSACR